jgi:hypothetical protein
MQLSGVHDPLRGSPGGGVTDSELTHSERSLEVPVALRPLRIDAQRTEILAPAARWAEPFRDQRSLVCDDIFEPALLASLLRVCGQGRFRLDDVVGLGTREVEWPQRAGNAIALALSRPTFLGWVERVTGSGKLERVEGRVVQTRPESGDGLDWHDDLNDPRRRLAITICLSDGPVEGGWFELRDAGTGRMLARHRHQAPGSALIFEVGSHLQHRLLPVTGQRCRRVFTGWFLG